MKNRKCILILLLIFGIYPITTKAQNKSLDSLTNLYSKEKDKKKQHTVLNQISEEYLKLKKAEKALDKGNHALKIGKEIQYKNELFATYVILGKIHSTLGNSKEAFENFDNALKIMKYSDNELKKAELHNSLGIYYERQDNYKMSIQMYFKALRYFEKVKDKKGLASVYNNIGIIHSNQGNYKQALYFYSKSLAIRNKLKDFENAATVYNNIGVVLLDQGKLDSAININHKSLRLNLKYKFQKGIALSFNNLGLCHRENQNIDSALYYHVKALDVNLKLNDKKGIALANYNLASDYFYQNNKGKALDYCEKSLALSVPENHLFITQAVYNLLEKIHEKSGDYKKANRYIKLSNQIKDSIYNNESMEMINDLNAKYESEKKDKALMQLKNEKKLKQLEIDKEKDEKKSLLIYLFGACVLITVLVLFSIVVKKTSNKLVLTNQIISKRNKEISEKKEEINKQAIQIAKYQSQMNPHFIFNAINGLQGMILKDNKLKAVEHLHTFTKLLRLTLNNSENEFLSIVDEIEYLYKYVEFELHTFSNKFEFEIKVSEDINLESLIPTMLIQPMIENAIKYADLEKLSNGKVMINMKVVKIADGDFLKVEIIDNGSGFKHKHTNHISKGMEITKQRILLTLSKQKHKIDSYFTVESPFEPNGLNIGTKITFILPYNNPSKK